MSSPALRLFAYPSLERDGVPVGLKRRRAMALLAYLAVTEESRSRESLLAFFWPEYDRGRARADLRRTLSTLKQALTGSHLEVDRDRAAIKKNSGMTVDVREFQRLITEARRHDHGNGVLCNDCRASLEKAANLYRGDFLEGFYRGGSPEVEDWQFFLCENLRCELAGVLERLVVFLSMREQYDRAIEYGRRWLALGPLEENAHRHLMRLYALCGRPAQAIRQYRNCAAVLETELAVEPDEETKHLCESIRKRRLSHPAAEHETAPPMSEQAIVGAFGVLEAHEDDAERAIRGALDIRAAALTQDAAVSMGIGYWPFLGMLRSCFRLYGQPDGKVRVDKIIGLLKKLREDGYLTHDQVEEIGPLLGNLLSIRYGTEWDEMLKAARPDEIRHRTFHALKDFFAGLAWKQPVVLVLDDLHWADSLSLDLLSHLTEAVNDAPLLIICVYRPVTAIVACRSVPSHHTQVLRSLHGAQAA